MKRHLIGIGGVGMSALATALVRLGDEVTGADRTLGTPNIRFLESLGVECFPDDGSGVDETTDEVIVSTAIEEDNPGLKKARELGIPVTHRAKALARTLAPYRLVAVVGTCGKSTVTAMLGHILAECGFDPMCVNGANVPGWEGAVRSGRGEYAVAEVDESDKSLVAFKPYAAVVTNASADHYSEEEMDEVFDAFVDGMPGPLVEGRKVYGEAETSIPGKHNRNNAFLALEMAKALGCDEAAARAALLKFGGVERRLQKIGDGVYDDYAHNPEKIRAMWTTLAEAHPDGICVVWRPHGYAPLRKMLDALAEMFNDTIRSCDKLLLLPVYDAGGTADRSVNSDLLADMIDSRKVVEVSGLEDAYEWIYSNRSKFSAVVTCGARDPELPILARRIAGG
jgi:UDP-N-acetylmuramate--alanine ligase